MWVGAVAPGLHESRSACMGRPAALLLWRFSSGQLLRDGLPAARRHARTRHAAGKRTHARCPHTQVAPRHVRACARRRRPSTACVSAALRPPSRSRARSLWSLRAWRRPTRWGQRRPPGLGPLRMLSLGIYICAARRRLPATATGDGRAAPHRTSPEARPTAGPRQREARTGWLAAQPRGACATPAAHLSPVQARAWRC